MGITWQGYKFEICPTCSFSPSNCKSSFPWWLCSIPVSDKFRRQVLINPLLHATYTKAAPRSPRDAEPSRLCPWQAEGCLGPSCLLSWASDCTKGDAIKSWGRGNLQVIFSFCSFRNQGGRKRMCVRSLMKSGTFEVNGAAIFFFGGGGGKFPIFC